MRHWPASSRHRLPDTDVCVVGIMISYFDTNAALLSESVYTWSGGLNTVFFVDKAHHAVAVVFSQGLIDPHKNAFFVEQAMNAATALIDSPPLHHDLLRLVSTVQCE